MGVSLDFNAAYTPESQDSKVGGISFSLAVKPVAPLAVFKLSHGARRDGCNVIAVLRSEKQGQYIVLAFSNKEEGGSFSFTQIHDRLHLGEHLLALGLQRRAIEDWNRRNPGAIVPITDLASEREAQEDIRRIAQKPASHGPG